MDRQGSPLDLQADRSVRRERRAPAGTRGEPRGRQVPLDRGEKGAAERHTAERLEDRPEAHRPFGADREGGEEEVVDRGGEHEAAGERIAETDALLEAESGKRERQSAEAARDRRRQSVSRRPKDIQQG